MDAKQNQRKTKKAEKEQGNIQGKIIFRGKSNPPVIEGRKVDLQKNEQCGKAAEREGPGDSARSNQKLDNSPHGNHTAQGIGRYPPMTFRYGGGRGG